MSETPEAEPSKQPAKPVSMSKGGRPAASSKPPVANLPLPNTVKLAMVGLGIVAAGVVVRALAIYSASSSTLRVVLIHLNNKAKKPKKNYGVVGDQQIVKDLHSLKTAYVPIGVITLVAIVFLVFGLRRARTASASRWVTIVAMFIPTGAIFGFSEPFGFPALAKVGGYAMSVGSIGAIVLLFLNPSTEYFKACRDASLPPELRGQPRPKLFGPRPTPASRAGATRPGAARPTSSRAAAPGPAANSTGGGRSKAKARSDADAVARGAELARSRARASKSRRSDV